MAERVLNILCFGLSHRTASVEIRERFAVSDGDLEKVTHATAALPGVDEAVIVSTCNRVEFYLAAANETEAFAAVERLLCERSGALPDGHFYRFDSPRSVRHLFRLVCGLDSMVLGETEVFGQVKKAYTAASSAGRTARHLNRLFQRAFNVGKEVRSKTNITRGAVSVGTVAVDLAQKIFGRLGACQVMIIGAGDTSEQTARNLLSRGARSIFVSNRSFDRAQALAGAMGGRALRFDEWQSNLEAIDIVISSTSAPHFLLTRDSVKAAIKVRGGRPLFVIDLAVPRDVDPAVNELDGVYLYDIDSLRTLAAEAMRDREQECAACDAIIERQVSEFLRWMAGHPWVTRGVKGAVPLPAGSADCRAVES